MDLQGWDFAKIAGILAGVWKVGVWIYRKMVKPIVVFIESHNKAVAKLDYVVNELQYNGGNSSKDQLKKITEITTDIKKTVDTIGNKQAVHFELAEAAMFECDAMGKCINANAALCSLFETTKEQMYGLGWINYIEQSDESKERWLQAIATDNEITDEYTIITARTKQRIDATYTSYIKRDEHGNIKNIMGKVYIK